MRAPDAAVELLSDLVRRRSVTPSDAGCQDLLADRLAAAGFHCERLDFGDVANLWARYGDTGPVLCFAGHTDVVPPGDPGAWQSDPFEPCIVGDRLYGRGAADMKSGLAAMIVAAESFLGDHPGIDGSLAFLLTSDEEGDAIDGTRRVIATLTERGDKPDWCVIGEPSAQRSAGDTIRVGRRGSLSAELLIKGRQGHVAYPHQVDNPVRRFAPVLAELHAVEWDDGHDQFPPTGFEVVHLQSGIGALNVTPPDLLARFNFRYTTGWTADRLQNAVTAILDRHGLAYDIRWQRQGEPFLTAPGRLIEVVSDAVANITGARPRQSTGGGTSDGRFIAPYGIDVVELGPANDSIHQVNEFVRLADIEALVAIYRGIMTRLLLNR